MKKSNVIFKNTNIHIHIYNRIYVIINIHINLQITKFINALFNVHVYVDVCTVCILNFVG